MIKRKGEVVVSYLECWFSKCHVWGSNPAKTNWWYQELHLVINAFLL